MPLYTHLMEALQKHYGVKRGKSIYYALRAEGKPPFKSKRDG